MTEDRPRIRPARPGDGPLLLTLIGELADYEALRHEVVATADALESTLFGERPAAEALIAEVGDAAAGFALFFPTYSTFLARPGLHLEDLFVRPAHRGRGCGRRLFRAVAATALERGCGRLEWAVLDWNTPAIDFYRRAGAEAMDGWTTHRLTGAALERAASGETP